MKLRYYKKEKRNWGKLISFFVVILLALGILWLVPRVFKERKSFTEVVPVFKEKKVEYYVPVTKYFSPEQNVETEDLFKLASEKKLYVEKGHRQIVGSFFDLPNLKEIEPKDITTTLKNDEVAIIRVSSASPAFKTLSYKGIYLWDKSNVGKYALKIQATGGETFEPAKLTKITALGDVMLSRHVNTQIKKFGFEYPWARIKARTANADITFANLEVPISDIRPAPAEGMSFIAPTKNLPQIKGAGIDLVSVANNHTANFGQKVFEDNLKNLNSFQVGICGGGLTEAESRKPVVIEKNETKFAFLCYNSITGGLASGAKSSGVATIKIEPWYRDNETDIKKMEEDIKEAKKIANVVIVSPHWGVEYKVNPNASQKKVAQRAIKAGADLIIGTHPHVVQGAEMINGKYVNYSLGNFIFDQEWSQETTEGVVLESYFYGNKLVAANLAPVKIQNYSQPSFAAGLNILSRIAKASIGF